MFKHRTFFEIGLQREVERKSPIFHIYSSLSGATIGDDAIEILPAYFSALFP